MNERLEDILGGVEEEIRLAEERLRLNSFGISRSAGGARPRAEDLERDGAGCSETGSASIAGGGGGGAVTSREANRLSMTDSLLADAVLSTTRSAPGAAGNARRRAWVNLEDDDGSPSGDGSRNGGGWGRLYGSMVEREAMINRLLRERDLRLNSSAEGQGLGVSQRRSKKSNIDAEMGAGNDGAVRGPRLGQEVARQNRSHRRRRGNGVVGRGFSDGSSTSGDEGSSSGRSSPDSTKGNVFFASDRPGAPSGGGGGAGGDVGGASAEGLDLFRLQGRDRMEILLSAHRSNDSYSNNYDDNNNKSENDKNNTINGNNNNNNNNDNYNNENSNNKNNHNSNNNTSSSEGGGGGGDAFLQEDLDNVCASSISETPSTQRSPTHPRASLRTKGSTRQPAPTELRLHPDKDRGVATNNARSRIGGRGSPRRREGKRKDEVAMARLEDQLSFRPKVYERSSSLQQTGQKQSASGGRRIDELARNRKGVYADRERQRRERQEEEETEECTFRPKICASAAASVVASQWDVSDGEVEGKRLPLHERLHKEAREREAARALAQHHLEKEALRECTFQPALIATETAVTVDQRPLHERVWEVEREREHKLRLLQAEREKQEGTTFAPPPLGRVSERLARDARPPVAAAAAAAATGAVAATAATAVAAGETRWGAGGKGMSRLKQQSMWARERRRKRVQEHEEAEARMSTFVPSISRGTQSLVRRRPELQAPFEERRVTMDAKKRERDRLRLEARAEEEMRWFNPTPARRTKALLRRHRPERLEETLAERVARMAGADDQRKQDFINLQRAKEERECTFRPSLNPVTLSMGQAAPLDELVNNRRGQRVRERARAKARDAQVCSHTPVLRAEAALLRAQADEGTPGLPVRSSRGVDVVGSSCKSSKSEEKIETKQLDARRSRGPRLVEGSGAAAALYGPGNKYRLGVHEPWRMTAELRARERAQADKIRAIRQEQQVIEMQRCTFVPQTNASILRAQGPVLVRGLGRHLELRDAAKQQEEERRVREAEAFGVRAGAVQRTLLGETVLKPFYLSEGNSSGWWEARRRKHEDETAARCTFKPWTVEGEKSKVLSRLVLEWSSSSSPGGSCCSAPLRDTDSSNRSVDGCRSDGGGPPPEAPAT